MKKVSIYELKTDLAAIIAEAEAGTEILVTRHNKPVARLTRPSGTGIHCGPDFGKGNLQPAVINRTAGRYLEVLEQDRQSGRE
jgi:antitoxin (DNA-binding transcriptional repressor) of toxin-antitoxin stability system